MYNTDLDYNWNILGNDDGSTVGPLQTLYMYGCGHEAWDEYEIP